MVMNSAEGERSFSYVYREVAWNELIEVVNLTDDVTFILDPFFLSLRLALTLLASFWNNCKIEDCSFL